MRQHDFEYSWVTMSVHPCLLSVSTVVPTRFAPTGAITFSLSPLWVYTKVWSAASTISTPFAMNSARPAVTKSSACSFQSSGTFCETVFARMAKLQRSKKALRHWHHSELDFASSPKYCRWNISFPFLDRPRGLPFGCSSDTPNSNSITVLNSSAVSGRPRFHASVMVVRANSSGTGHLTAE